MAVAPQEGSSTRERLVRTAMRLFAERGYAGVSNREIVEACGLTKGAIYWYFESKEHLFRTVVAETLERWEHRVMEAIGQASTPEQKLSRTFRLFVEVLDDPEDPHRDLLVLMTHRQSTGPGQETLGHAAHERFVTWLQSMLTGPDAAPDSGDIVDLVVTVGFGILVQAASGYDVARPVLSALLRLLGGGDLYPRGTGATED